MFRRVATVRPVLWGILALIIAGVAGLVVASYYGLIAPRIRLYVAQPVFALLVAGLTYAALGRQQDRVRHKREKALLVGSTLSVWFVIYFLSGFVVTYVHNAVFSSVLGVILNILAYTVTAAAFEYTRHGVLLAAGRRNIVWFGLVVSLVFALQQMNLVGLKDAQGVQEVIQLAVSDFVPMFMMSFLLSYLAVTAGLQSQLVLRLGLVAIILLPPIIPKYDWYMLGVALVLLSAVTYIVMDRTRQDRETMRIHLRRRHSLAAFDIMSTTLIVALVLFMTGLFNYKPLVIMSNSMVPVFSRGSVVVVQKTKSPMDIQVGDIIQYQTENKTITHRVVAINVSEDGEERVFTTKGDNNKSPDLPVKQKQVAGVVRSTVPYVGYPTVWLREFTAGR